MPFWTFVSKIFDSKRSKLDFQCRLYWGKKCHTIRILWLGSLLEHQAPTKQGKNMNKYMAGKYRSSLCWEQFQPYSARCFFIFCFVYGVVVCGILRNCLGEFKYSLLTYSPQHAISSTTQGIWHFQGMSFKMAMSLCRIGQSRCCSVR